MTAQWAHAAAKNRSCFGHCNCVRLPGLARRKVIRPHRQDRCTVSGRRAARLHRPPAGGSLSPRLKQPFIIENRPAPPAISAPTP